MTPIEKIARVLCRLDGLDPDAGHRPRSGPVILDVAVEQPAWKQYAHKSRAVLEAVREPSEKMVAAHNNAEDCYDDYPRQAAVDWQAMIDAALADAPTP